MIPRDFTGVLFIYGMRQIDPKLLKWTAKDPSNHLVLIEDEEDFFFALREDPACKNRQVKLYFYSGDGEELCRQIALDFLMLSPSFAIAKEEKKAKAEAFFQKLKMSLSRANLLAADSQDLGVTVLSHLYANQHVLQRSLLGESLKGCFVKIPAIVVGAGPSLDAQIELLRSLKDKALIIAGGSAVSILSRHQIRPDFCVHLDPNPPRERFLRQDVHEVPHFYRSRFSPELLSVVHGAVFWMPGSGSYPMESWIQEQYDVPSDSYDGGWTVANFCTALAHDLGCDPIITIGMEFSHNNQAIYAGDLSGEEHKQEWIPITVPGKQTLYSKNDWMMSAEWLQDFVERHRETCMINATEGGLEIQGMRKGRLQDLDFRQSVDVQGLIHARIKSSHPFPAEGCQIERVCSQIKESFLKARALCIQLLALWEKHYPGSPLETGEYLLLQSDLERLMVYIYVLSPLWHLWKGPILRKNDHPLSAHLHELLFFMRVTEENQSWMS